MFRRNKFKEGGVYVRLRPIAVVSRLLGIFPLAGVLRRDGRLLSRIPYIKRVGISTSKYLAIVHPSHIWDFSLILTLIINICSIFLRVDLVPADKMTQNTDSYSLEREEYPGTISITSQQNLLKKLPGITFKQLSRSGWKWLKTPTPDKLPDSFSSRTSFLKETPNSYFSRIPQNIRMLLPGVGNGIESAVSLGKLSLHAYRPEEKRTVGMRGSRLHRSSSPTKVISDGPSSYHKLARRSLIDDGHPRLTGVLPVIWGTLPLDPSKKPLGWENGQYLKSVLIKMIYNNLSTNNELSHISQLTSTNEPYKKHSESRRNPGATSVLMRKLSFNSIKQSAPRILKNFGKIFDPRSFSLLNRGHKVYRDMVTGFPRSASKRDISDMWRGSSGGLERFSSSPNVTHKKSTKLIKSASMGFTFMGVICQALLFVVARLNAGRSACLIALMEDLSDALRLLESESRTHRNKSRSHIPRNQRETIYITRGMTRIPKAVIEEEESNVITKKCDRYYESNASTNISTASFSVEGSSSASKNRVNIKRFLIKENSHLEKNEKEKDFKLYPAAKIVHESFSVGNGIKITERKFKGPIFRQPKYFIGSRGRSTKNRMIRQKSRKLNHGERCPIEGCKKDSKRFWKETFKWGSVAKHVSSNDGGVDYGMASGLRKTFRKEEMRKFQSYRGRRNAHISFSTVSMVGYVILLSWLLIFYTRFFVIGDPPFPPFEKSSAMAIPPEDDLPPVIEPELHDSASSNVLEVTDRDYGQHTSGTKRASTRQVGHRMILEIHLTNRTSMAEARVTTLRNNRGEQLESGSIDVRDSAVHRNADEILFDTPKKSVNEIQDKKSSVILTYHTRVRPQVFLWIASATITSSYFYLHIVQVLFFLFEACALFERVNFLVTNELEQYIGISEEGTGSNHRKGCIGHLIGASWGLRRKINGCTNCKLHSRLETLRLLRSAICSLIMGMETRQVVNAHRRGMDLRKNNFRWNSFSPIFKNNYGRVSFIDTSGSSLLDPRTGLATASEAPTQHRMTRERKGNQALMCFRQKGAEIPRLWTKPLKKRKSLDMQAPAGGSRKHTDLPGDGDINGKKISSIWKEQVNVFEKKNSVLPTLSKGILLSPNSTKVKDKKNRLAASMNSIPPPKSGMCSRKGNFREIPTNGEWLKELCDKFVALRGRKCIRKKPIGYNRSPRVKMTTKNRITQIHTLSTEVPSDGMNQQVANNAGWQNLCNLKSSWIDKNDVNVIDTEKKSKCFSQPCPCENLFSCGRVLGINGCQGTIILFLTMKSLVDVLLAFTVSIARGYMSGWQIPLQLFRIIGMATVALAATSLSEKARAGIWTMNAVRLEDMDEKSASQLNQLIVQLTASPVEVTASGYFSLTKGFLISIMSVIATYVIIIIQFKLSEA